MPAFERTMQAGANNCSRNFSEDVERSNDYLEENLPALSLDHLYVNETFARRPGVMAIIGGDVISCAPEDQNPQLSSVSTASNLASTSLLSQPTSSEGSRRLLVKKMRENLDKKSFGIQAFLFWLCLGVPGNVVTVYLYSRGPLPETEAPPENETNQTNLECHELTEEWHDTVAWSQYLIQGVSIALIGTLGFIANIISVIVLLRCKENRNFHRLLAGLSIVDSIMILILVLEISVVGVFMKKEPGWYVLAYPYLIHPGRGIVQTASIFMVVAVSTERYKAVCSPLMRRQRYYKYIGVVVALAITIEFPRFFEMKLNESHTQYWTTDLMENPDYVQFSSYWNEIIATGLVPLILLCYMNLRIFLKIKASSEYALRFVSNQVPLTLHQCVGQIKEPSQVESRCNMRAPLQSGDDTLTEISHHNGQNGHNGTFPSKPISGARFVRKRQEKSAAILVSIIVVFLLCHIHRLAFRMYEMALPETSLFQHYQYCTKQKRYHVPVAIYFLTHMHYLFLAINSSVNFIIYCAMGQHFRKTLRELVRL